jgi:hypothetical protein
VGQYVERALHARLAQGLPATIQDRETLDRLALLMTATSATDRRDVIAVEAQGLPWQQHRANVSRPRPGANQTGAGSFTTQHTAGYGEDATPSRRDRTRGGAA